MGVQGCGNMLRRFIAPIARAGSRAGSREKAPLIRRSNVMSVGRNDSVRRLLCTKASAGAKQVEAKPVGRIQLMLGNWMRGWSRLSYAERWQRVQKYAIVGGTVFTCVVVVQVFIKSTSYLVNITSYQAFMGGMTTGAVITTTALLSAYSVRRSLQVRPDPIYRLVLKFLHRDERVVKALGKPMKTGKFRAYRYESHFPKAKLQLMFELTGQHHDASCSVEVAKTWNGKYEFDLLAVGVHGSGERILLSGDGTRQLSGNVSGLK